MKIGKQKLTGFRFSEDREEERKKKKKRSASGGGRRQAPDTRRPPAGATQLQRGVDTCRLQAGPNRNASRADRTGPGWPTRDCAELGARGRRACSLRLAPSRARGLALPACCWARERTWNGQFGPVVFRFLDFCPGSSSNTVFTWIGT